MEYKKEIKISGSFNLDIKILAKKGVSEVLEILGEAEGNSALGNELREKAGIHKRNLSLLVDEGVLERSEERVLVRTIPIMRRIATFSITDKGKRLLEICENLTEEEAEDFLKVSKNQLDVLRIFLKEGPKRSRDLPEAPTDFLNRMVNRGFLDKDVKEFEDKQEIYRNKRTYMLTDKGKKIYEAYKTIISL